MTLVWSSNRRVDLPAERSHRRRVLSHDPERAKWPSDDRTTSETKCEWPYRRFWGTPKLFSSRVSFQTINVLSERKAFDLGWFQIVKEFLSKINEGTVWEFSIMSFKWVSSPSRVKHDKENESLNVLTSGGRQDHVGEFRVGGNLGNPSIVTTEGTTKFQRFAVHFLDFFKDDRDLQRWSRLLGRTTLWVVMAEGRREGDIRRLLTTLSHLQINWFHALQLLFLNRFKMAVFKEELLSIYLSE